MRSLCVLFGFIIHGLVTTGQSSSVEQIRSMPNDGQKLKEFIELSRAIESQDIDQSYLLLDEALTLSEKIDEPYWTSKLLMEKGVLHYMAGMSDLSMEELRKASGLCPQDSIRLMGRIENNIGSVHLQLEQIDSALISFGRSKKLYEQIDGYEGLIALLQNIGICHYELGDSKKALEKLEESYQWIIKSGNLEHLETLTINIMLILIETGQSNETKDHFERLMSNKIIQKSPITQVKMQEILGYYHQSNEEYDMAIQYYNKAYELNKQFGFSEQEQLDLALAQTYDLTERHQEANSILMGMQPLLISMQKQRFRALAENHEHLNQADSSAKYWKAYVQTLISELETLDKVESSSIDHDIEIFSKEKEIKDLEQEKLILGLENSRRRWMITALAFLSAGLFVAFFWLRKLKRKELKFRSLELKEKQQKLMSLSLQMSQKNALFTDITQVIAKTSGSLGEIATEAKRDLEIMLKHASRMDEDWKLFSHYFEDLHNGYYERLKKHSEALTSLDLRMCSLLRLRLSTKEIMDILFLSQDAVKSARSRIRKKLALDKVDNLTEFLQEI